MSISRWLFALALVGHSSCMEDRPVSCVLLVVDVFSYFRRKFLQCVWDSYTGATFDLHQLMRVVDQESYTIVDGDIPCTPAAEPSYAYAFNICGDVTSPSVPEICTDNGAALQWAWGKVWILVYLRLIVVSVMSLAHTTRITTKQFGACSTQRIQAKASPLATLVHLNTNARVEAYLDHSQLT